MPRGEQSTELSSQGKPLLRRSSQHNFKTILSLDGGALRGAVTVMVLIEVEQSIKQYLLDHPECLPEGLEINSLDDFEINLADYFDCVTGYSSGAWIALYLASRGGQGASRFALDDPEIVEKYGLIPTGAAAGLRVFYNEYGSTIYPLHTIDMNAGTPLDPANPLAPGCSSPLHSLDGLERSLDAFLGDTTLADADTTLLVPAVDLGTGLTMYFVRNAFREPPVTSVATLVARMGPRIPPTAGGSILPDITFDEGKNYYLKDIGAASGSAVTLHPAKPMSQVGEETAEFQLVDGGMTKENTDLFGGLFVSSEARLHGFDKLAILSIGTGVPSLDLTPLCNAGNAQWAQNFNMFALLNLGGVRLWPALMDYLYYANPATKPFQYLRINGLGSTSADSGLAESSIDASAVPRFEEYGQRVASEHRQVIDIFVRDFIFG